MEQLETELERARGLAVSDLADAIESIGFECTRCGACCRGADCGDETAEHPGTTDVTGGGDDEHDDDGKRRDGGSGGEEHTATVFPDEVRQLQERGDYDWRDVARPMPYGLTEGPAGPEGETFEWALATDDCGDCTFYDGNSEGGVCTVHEDRPLICRTYPFSVSLGGTSQPMGEAVDSEGIVRAHECEGLGREMPREAAVELARALRQRAIRELEEAIAVRDSYEPADAATEGVVVHDSEGAKRPDGTPR
jgi:Fe-S-cluster containining protein